MKTCIINVAIGSGYSLIQDRLAKSLDDTGYKGDRLFWKNTYPKGCPAHTDVPYAFKPYALQEARQQGYSLALWVDSALWAIRPVDTVFEHIEKHGYLFFDGGFKTGTWCSDAALETLKITREESFTYPHLMACCMGFDLRNPIAQQFLDQYFALANDGITFKGAWTNDKGQVSKDTRVRGHRHDQTAASIIAWKLGMREWLAPHLTYLLYDESREQWINKSLGIVFLSK